MDFRELLQESDPVGRSAYRFAKTGDHAADANCGRGDLQTENGAVGGYELPMAQSTPLLTITPAGFAPGAGAHPCR